MRSLLLLGLFLSLGMARVMNVQNQNLIKSIDQFSNKLLSEYLSDEKSNVEKGSLYTDRYIISPLSVYAPLFILCVGADSMAKTQLVETLHTECQKPEIKTQFQNLLSVLNRDQGPVVKMASGLFVSNHYSLNPHFIESEKETLTNADIKSIDFAKAADSARTINKWIENKTDNYIHDIVKAGELNADLAMMIVNTLFLKAAWDDKFYGSAHEDIFTNIYGVDQTVLFMYGSQYSRVADVSSLRATAIEKTFRGDDLSFIVFLPTGDATVLDVENGLRTLDYSSVFSPNIEKWLIDLILPKFNITHSIKLNPVLEKMGLAGLIEHGGNFRKLVGRDLRLSEITQDVRLEVDEEGIRASAVTIVKGVSYSMPPRYVVNKPFAFVIRDNVANVNLFVGSVRSL